MYGLLYIQQVVYAGPIKDTASMDKFRSLQFAEKLVIDSLTKADFLEIVYVMRTQLGFHVTCKTLHRRMVCARLNPYSHNTNICVYKCAIINATW